MSFLSRTWLIPGAGASCQSYQLPRCLSLCLLKTTETGLVLIQDAQVVHEARVRTNRGKDQLKGKATRPGKGRNRKETSSKVCQGLVGRYQAGGHFSREPNRPRNNGTPACEKHLVYGGWLTESRTEQRPARVCLLLRGLMPNRPVMVGPELEERPQVGRHCPLSRAL